MGGNDSKPEEAAGAPPARPAAAPPAATPPAASPPAAAPPAPAPKKTPDAPKATPTPAPAASASGPIGNPKDMRLTVPPNDAAALKCLVAARAGGIAAYQVAGEVRRDPPFPPSSARRPFRDRPAVCYLLPHPSRALR